MDYTTIENPYSNFVDRTIASDVPVSPDQDVREGGSVKDLWITSFIRSTNWRPGNTGFTIDGTTGTAEFQDVTMRKVFVKKVVAITNEIVTVGVSDYLSLSIDSSITVAAGSSAMIAMSTTDTGKSMGLEMKFQGNTGANTVKGISMETWNSLGTADHFGLYITMPNAWGGASYAFGFNGSEITNSAVGGSQDKKIKIKIGSTAYYIPCYTA